VDPITVPFAPTSYKVVCGIPLLIFAALAFYWGSKNLGVCVRMLQGKLPLPEKSSPPFVVIGVVFWLAVLAAGVGTTAFFAALETTQPTVVSEEGIRVGAGPPRYQEKFIAWNEITRVTCWMPARENRVRSLGLFTRDTKVGLGNAGVMLDSILAMAKQKTPSGTVQPCKHVSMNHSWSY